MYYSAVARIITVARTVQVMYAYMTVGLTAVTVSVNNRWPTHGKNKSVGLTLYKCNRPNSILHALGYEYFLVPVQYVLFY